MSNASEYRYRVRVCLACCNAAGDTELATRRVSRYAFNHERTVPSGDQTAARPGAVAMAGRVPEITEGTLSDRDTILLRALDTEPDISQRDLARRTGISLGAVNYCLRALAGKGLVKVRNFQASDRKLRYAYVLTPAGIEAKTRLTARFLKRKVAEYERLQAEIAELEAELGASKGGESDGR